MKGWQYEIDDIVETSMRPVRGGSDKLDVKEMRVTGSYSVFQLQDYKPERQTADRDTVLKLLGATQEDIDDNLWYVETQLEDVCQQS